MTIRKIQTQSGTIEIDTHTSTGHVMLTANQRGRGFGDDVRLYMTHDQLLALIGLAIVSETELAAAKSAPTKEKKR